MLRNRWLKLYLLIVAFASSTASATASAQPLDFSDPLHLAKIALGDEQGFVAVGILKGGIAQAAYTHRSGANAALITSADGSAASTPTKAVEEQLFEIGSITKVFTGLLLAQAVERGDLSLADSLAKLLKGTVNFQSTATAAITLRQLITHSSCLPRSPNAIRESLSSENPYANFTREDIWADLGQVKLESPAPCIAGYSNFGMAVVGEILSDHYKMPWIDLITTRITEPLGMKDTMQTLGPKTTRLAQGYNNLAKINGWDFKAMAGAGALRSTLSDMLIFSKAMMAGRNGPLGLAAERMLQPLGRFQSSQIGYSVFIRGPENRRTYMHDGLTGGYRAQWLISPSTQEAVITLAGNSHAPISRMHAQLLAGLYPSDIAASAQTQSNVNAYSGVFRIDKNSTLSFVAQDAKLYRRFTGGGYRAVKPAGPDNFVDEDFAAQYAFKRSNGEVTGVLYIQGGGDLTALKTQESPHVLAVAAPDQAKEYTGRYLMERGLRRSIDFDVKEEAGQLMIRSSNWQRQNHLTKTSHRCRLRNRFRNLPDMINRQLLHRNNLSQGTLNPNLA